MVHLASPVFLGAHGAAVARRLGLPAVAVYQTDLPSYARAYRLGRLGETFAWRWLRGIHNGAARTLAPSTVTATGLLGQGIGNVWLWGRGVDTRRFDPAKRSQELRATLLAREDHGGDLLVGYVGRLATEKRVELLAGITALAGVRLVIVGAGRPRPCCAGTCLMPSSSASAAAMSWPPSTPAWTSSCAAGL